MSVSEARRHELYEAAKAVFGESNAETFMNLHPNIDWDTLATKDDVARLEARLEARLDTFATKDELRRLGSDFKLEMAAFEVRIQNRFTTVLLASQGVLLAAITLLVTITSR